MNGMLAGFNGSEATTVSIEDMAEKKCACTCRETISIVGTRVESLVALAWTRLLA